MKTPTFLLLLTLIAPLTSSHAQEFPATDQSGRRGGFGGGGGGGGTGGGGGGFGVQPAPTPSTNLPVFDLDFPGGTPRQLVTAIEKASGKPLNAIIPEETAQTQIPGMKMKGVTVARLFEALQRSSAKTVPIVSGYSRDMAGERTPTYSYQSESYGFMTEGSPNVDSIWYFRLTAPIPPPVPQVGDKACQFYQLGPYLDHDYKVEDITTAIETGWKMLGVKTPPTLNFHKETKLLIAVGILSSWT